MTIKASKIISTTILLLAGFLSCIAMADSQLDPAVSGQGSGGCAGTYYAMAKMTNSSGTYWITPPANSHTGTFKVTGTFTSVLSVVRRVDLQPFCGTNSLTFPATNSSYTLTLYVTSHTPPPTNNQPVALQVTWQ